MTVFEYGGRLLIERRTTEAASPPEVAVLSPTGATSRMPLRDAGPGRTTAELPAGEPGVWQVSDGTHIAYAAAGSVNPAEIADLRATTGKLQAAARASGGSARFIGAGLPELRRTESGREASGSAWIGLPRRRDHVVTGIDSIPLLPPWAALPLVLGLIVVAWRREGAT